MINEAIIEMSNGDFHEGIRIHNSEAESEVRAILWYSGIGALTY